MEPTIDELRLFWNRAGVPCCILDADRRLAAVNAAWTELLGWREDQLLGHRPEEFIHPDDLARYTADVVQARGDRRVLEFENRYRHVDGSVRWLQWTGYEHDGRWYAVARDITAMHISQRALQLSERRSRAMLSALREGLVIVGADRRILEVNDRFAEMTGWSGREVVGLRPPFPWWPPGADGERADEFLRAAVSGDHATRELLFVRRNGESFRALVDEAPLEERPGASPATLSVVRDITELADTRDRLREAHEVARLCSWEWFDEDDRVVITYDGMRTEMPPRYEVAGSQVISILAPEDRERARRLRDETAAGAREEFVAEFRVVAPSLGVQVVEWRGRPLRRADGRIVGVRGTAQDLSARRPAAQEASAPAA